MKTEEQFYSQTGEDAFMAEIFDGMTSGTCLEVGVLDGIKDSTTLFFEKKGWSCILVEANPELAEKAKLNRRGPVFSCAAGREAGTIEFLIAHGAEYLSTMMASEQHISRIISDGGRIERVKVPVTPVDEILKKAGVKSLDFATIDVEGAELEVLLGFDLGQWQPKVLVLEDNSGGRDLRAHRHVYSQGYRCFHNDGLNNWYAHKNDRSVLTFERRFFQFRRRIRSRLYRMSVGLLPVAAQIKLVALKRKWLKKL